MSRREPSTVAIVVALVLIQFASTWALLQALNGAQARPVPGVGVAVLGLMATFMVGTRLRRPGMALLASALAGLAVHFMFFSGCVECGVLDAVIFCASLAFFATAWAALKVAGRTGRGGGDLRNGPWMRTDAAEMAFTALGGVAVLFLLWALPALFGSITLHLWHLLLVLAIFALYGAWAPRLWVACLVVVAAYLAIAIPDIMLAQAEAAACKVSTQCLESESGMLAVFLIPVTLVIIICVTSGHAAAKRFRPAKTTTQ